MDLFEPDCEQMMDEYTSYDEKIVKGLIVQMYYFGYSPNVIKTVDHELKAMAAECHGTYTGEQGITNGRRDIDFEFQDAEHAATFSQKILASARFYLHQGINVYGQLHPKPSIHELEVKKEQLKKINCGEDDCDQ